MPIWMDWRLISLWEGTDSYGKLRLPIESERNQLQFLLTKDIEMKDPTETEWRTETDEDKERVSVFHYRVIRGTKMRIFEKSDGRFYLSDSTAEPGSYHPSLELAKRAALGRLK